jgi:hypothetical protein
VPDVPPHDGAPQEMRALVAMLREANAWLRELVEAKDAQLAAAQEQEEAEGPVTAAQVRAQSRQAAGAQSSTLRAVA